VRLVLFPTRRYKALYGFGGACWCIPPRPRREPRASPRACVSCLYAVGCWYNRPVVRFSVRKGVFVRCELLISQYRAIIESDHRRMRARRSYQPSEGKRKPRGLCTLGAVAVPMLYLFILIKSAIRRMKNTIIQMIMNIVYTSLLLPSIIPQ